MEYKILRAWNTPELTKTVTKHIEDGWKPKGSHQIVRKHEQLRYAGMQHKDTTYEYEYSQTIIKKQ